MGLLDEIMRQLQEAADEARRQQQPGGAPKPPPPAANSPGQQGDAERLRRRLAQAASDKQAQRHANQVANEAGREHVEAQRRREAAAAAERADQAEVNAAQKVRRSARQAAVDAPALGRLLRQPTTVRRLIVFSEILQKPLALRRRR
jgi:hypothetical protein